MVNKGHISIIGAGIGGLTAGAYLARMGFSVHVLEQSHGAGGCCQTFTRKSHRFDAAASLFLGMGKRGYNPLFHSYKDFGHGPDVIELDPCFRLINNGDFYRIRSDFEQYIRDLEPTIPAASEQMRVFHRKIGTIRKAIDQLPFHRPFSIRDKIIWFLKSFWALPVFIINDRRSILDRMEKSITDTTLLTFLKAQLQAFAIDNARDCPAILGSLLYTEIHKGGLYYPRGGSGELARSLVREIKAHNGSVSYKTSVKEIIVRDGRVHGVKLENGDNIDADIVISNASVWDTLGKLVNEKDLPGKLVSRVQSLKPTSSIFIVYLSLDKEFVEQHFDVHTMWAPKGEGFPPMMLSIPSLVDNSAAPTGKHAGMLYSESDYSTWIGNSDYKNMKIAETERVMGIIEKRVPGFRESSEIIATATPLTIERYTRRSFGSSGGPRSTLDQWDARNLPNRTPVKGLFMVGDSTFPGAGVVAVTVSGIMCADEIDYLS